MNIKYVLKGLFLVILIPLTIYYFFNTLGSEVTVSSIFILIFTVMSLYEEIILSSNNSVTRKKYQLVIDRTLVILLIAISIDVVVSLFLNGISL